MAILSVTYFLNDPSAKDKLSHIGIVSSLKLFDEGQRYARTKYVKTSQ